MMENISTNSNAEGFSGASRTIGAPFPADADDPQHVIRTHLEKSEIGKSKASCKLSLVMRLHRSAALQEFWCASYEEASVYLNLAVNPKVLNIKEQFTRVDYEREDGTPAYTLLDAHVVLKNGEEVLVSVKYPEKANRPEYLAEVRAIAAQCSREIADRMVVLSRASFSRVWQDYARRVHYARRGWDPDADVRALEVARKLSKKFTFGEWLTQLDLGPRGERAALRLLGDGDVSREPNSPVSNEMICWRAA